MKFTEYRWKISYKNFEPGKEGLREAICTLGNGYVGVRGAAPEATASGVHYPGTYVAGVYNRLKTRIAGKTVTNEDMVNCPNWAFLTFKIGDGDWFSPSSGNLLSFYQELDLKKGILTRRLLVRDWKGRRTLIESSRLVHMGNPHCLAMKYIIRPENYSEKITIKTMLDGTVANSGVERYRKLNSQHLIPHSLGAKGAVTHLSVATCQSRIVISEAAKVNIFSRGGLINPRREIFTAGKKAIGEELEILAKKNRFYQVEKIAAIYTSKDGGVKDPALAAVDLVKRSGCFAALLKRHKKAWGKLWEKADVKVEGNTFQEKILRLHTFHLLQTGSLHTVGLDVGLPARGLHGEAYRGHIFWDSIFVLPFYELHFPQVSKSVLLYRYRRLPQARAYAKSEGYAGAMFPWQSGSSGAEETQVMHLNPLSGEWDYDYSRLQRHVSFAIAYNVWHYWETVRDLDFLSSYGAEVILSIAQFGASLARYSKKDARYHTKKIMGPDEFHEKYPRAACPGLKDNAYTNFMIVWTIIKAKEIIGFLPRKDSAKIIKRIGLEENELRRWDDIAKKMKIVFDPQGIISQFEGYFKLKEIDLNKYSVKYKNIQRMDRILKAEGESPDDYKISKQADVLMIFYLFSLGEISGIFKRLGYNFNREMMRENYEYYTARTTHGSTLSRVSHCLVAQRLGKLKAAWQWFQDVLESDFYDIQGGTTSEGVHLGVMGGSLDIIIRGFLGMRTEEERLLFEPKLPQSWRALKLNLSWRGNWLLLTAAKKYLHLHLRRRKKNASPLIIEIHGKTYRLLLGKELRIPLKNRQKENSAGRS